MPATAEAHTGVPAAPPATPPTAGLATTSRALLVSVTTLRIKIAFQAALTEAAGVTPVHSLASEELQGALLKGGRNRAPTTLFGCSASQKWSPQVKRAPKGQT